MNAEYAFVENIGQLTIYWLKRKPVFTWFIDFKKAYDSV